MYKLIQVKYQNNDEGLVDAVMLDDLIVSNKIKRFYRPSESRWVDIDRDWVRVKANGYVGPERRDSLKNKKEPKPTGFLSRFFKYRTTQEALTAQDWFEQGFELLYNEGNQHEAIRAFTLCIKLNPFTAGAYLNRGIAYEQIGNEREALEDYSKAIHILPHDARAYYVRGILLWRSKKYLRGIDDLKKSAELGYKLAIDFCTQKRIA